MTQRSLKTILMLLIPGLVCACADAPETVARPNVILIMTDDPPRQAGGVHDVETVAVPAGQCL